MEVHIPDYRLALRVMLSVLDLLLVTYLIYRVLRLIRGTRAQQVLLGLVLVVMAFFGARLLGLKMIYGGGFHMSAKSRSLISYARVELASWSTN